MSRIGNALIVILFGIIIGVGIYTDYMWPRWKVIDRLESEGYYNAELSAAWINRAPIACSGEHTEIYTFRADHNNRKVTGFACYRGWILGAYYWED